MLQVSTSLQSNFDASENVTVLLKFRNYDDSMKFQISLLRESNPTIFSSRPRGATE